MPSQADQADQVDQYAVIGNPVAHSKSPAIHTRFAASCHQAMQYQALLAPLDGFAFVARQFFGAGGMGANVTLPFKVEAFALADELTPRARAAGAVNTLCWRAGRILGDNTDGIGLVHDIVRMARQPIAGQRVLMVGAGGAARGALLPLLEQQPAQLVLANRTHASALQLLAQFQAIAPNPNLLSACELAALEGKFDLIINATSASIAASVPALAPDLLGPQCLAYDMMYGAQPTVFMAWASSHGARVRDGLGMLLAQAAEAFYLWRGVYPEVEAVYASLRAELT